MDSVIVTGSGTGLGKATSLLLAEKGFAVYATAPDPSQIREIEETARQHGLSNLRARQLDITDEQNIASVVEAVHNETGGPFALVNNAGIGLRGFFEDLAEEEIQRLFETNIFGTMAVTRAVLPCMRAARRGRIVIITSIGGKIASMGISAYCATKFAQEGFGESLYQELLPFGINVVLVEPAITKTERWDIHRGTARGASRPDSPYRAWFERAEALADKLVATTPTEPEHVAQAVHRSLAEKRPRLRYMVGRRARLVYALRRYLPDTLFERVYFGQVVRHVTRTG